LATLRQQSSVVRKSGVYIFDKLEVTQLCAILSLPEVTSAGIQPACAVRIEDVDIYDYIHFSVIQTDLGSGEAEAKSGQSPMWPLSGAFLR
jgi:hypothetical protein